MKWFRSWKLWKYYRDYFPVSLIKTAELDPNKNYILGYHPHGVMCTGAFCNFATDATGFEDKFPGMRSILLALDGQFMFPIYREYLMTTGRVGIIQNSYCIKETFNQYHNMIKYCTTQNIEQCIGIFA